MSPLQAFILGAVQGATEFLPISSSGHLVLVPWLFGWELDPSAAFIFDVLVQWGTLLAVIIYFFKDLVSIAAAVIQGILEGKPFSDPIARLGWLLLVASLPAALLGVLAKSTVEAAFANPQLVSLFLLATAAILALSERIGDQLRSMDEINLPDALIIGLAQSLALFPGISRSGATIAGGLIRDLKRPDAARFSFLMSVPIMIGAGGIALLDLSGAPGAMDQLPALLIGFVTAAIVGYLAIHWLLAYLAQHRLNIFIYYCTLVGLGGFLLSVIQR